METSELNWKHTNDSDISVSTDSKMMFPNQKICLILMFPSCFQLHSNVSNTDVCKFIIKFLVGCSFQLNTRVSKLNLFLSCVSKSAMLKLGLMTKYCNLMIGPRWRQKTCTKACTKKGDVWNSCSVMWFLV